MPEFAVLLEMGTFYLLDICKTQLQIERVINNNNNRKRKKKKSQNMEKQKFRRTAAKWEFTKKQMQYIK